MAILSRLKHAWNVFMNVDRREPFESATASYGTRPDRVRLRFTSEKTILSSILTRIAIDVADVKIKHVKLDDQDRFDSVVNSGLNSCLTLEANVDQAARAFRQDVVMSMFDEGVIALVPIDTTLDPHVTNSWDVVTMRVGRIVQWWPTQVRVSLYNEKTGMREEVTVPKSYAAIVENPMYSVMNEPNSTLQRLIRKLNMLDAVDEQSSSGKLDLIIQLPYTIKSEARRQQAEQRRKDIEFQLKGSQYGIAYTDGTEKVTQLNRPAENNLLKQVEYLTELLYSQLGITKEVMDGTAAQPVMLNYFNRTIKPILDAIVEAMIRTFLTKTARTQGQSVMYFYDPFAIIPVDQLAEIADKFTRNEILSSNEIRQIVGRPPVKDKKADQLRNSNMPQSELGQNSPPPARLPPVKAMAERLPALPS
jgi:Phage portal protein